MKRTIYIWIGIGLMAASGWGAEQGGEEEHHGHRHHVSLFLGNTHDLHGNNAFTVGVDYEYRLNDLFGVGTLIDHAGGSINSTVVGAGLFIHPWQDLRVLTALGNEHQSGHNEFLFRLGALYDFHIKEWSITPALYMNWLESGHQNWVSGIELGRGF